jgi:hypothetical protein
MKWFIKLDILVAFYKIKIIKGNKWKIAFYIKYKFFKWLITPFKLANVLSTF